MGSSFPLYLPPIAARVRSDYSAHWEKATVPVKELVCGSIPVVAAEAVVPNPVAGIARAVWVVEVGVIALEPAGPSPAVAETAARIAATMSRPAGPSPAVVDAPGHSASGAAVRPKTLQRRVRRAPGGHCGYAARCRARPARPLPQ